MHMSLREAWESMIYIPMGLILLIVLLALLL